MDDLRSRNVACLRALLAGTVLLVLSGCSLGVMFGKMLTGETLQTCAFRQQTRVDLRKDDRRVIVICSTPEALRSDWSSLNIDLIDGVTRRLKIQGIKVIDPDDVATWIDDNGGSFEDLSELSDEFEADYIVHVHLDRFTFLEENSKTLFRGRAHGSVTAHEVVYANGSKTPRIVFERELNSEYPGNYPMSTEQIDAKVFQKRYMDQVCNQVAQLFYDHRLGDEFE